MTTKSAVTLSAFLITFLESVSAATTVASSTFDTDIDGWSDVPGETTSLTHQPTGGNPGGYIQNVDMGPSSGSIVAPMKFLGDWSAFDGVGTLSWDFNLFDDGVHDGQFATLKAFLFGPGGSATFDSGIFAPVGTWISVNAPIQQAAWSVDAGNWSSLLADVNELRIVIEPVFSTGLPRETSGIDNVILSSVPIPASVYLLLSTCLGLLGFRRRRCTSNCES